MEPKGCRDQASQQASCRPEQGWHWAWGGFPGVPGKGDLAWNPDSFAPNTLRQDSHSDRSHPGKNGICAVFPETKCWNSQTSLVAQWKTICLQCRRRKLGRFSRKVLWRREWQPTPVFWLENPMDRGAWWAIVYGVAKSWTHLKLLSTLSVGLP